MIMIDCAIYQLRTCTNYAWVVDDDAGRHSNDDYDDDRLCKHS